MGSGDAHLPGVRIVHGIAAPGADATTLGNTVFVRAGVHLGPLLARHEFEHVLQFRRYGWIGFFRRYLPPYLLGRLRRRGHLGAYRRIPFEIEADWRSRRSLGLGVVTGAGPQ